MISLANHASDARPQSCVSNISSKRNEGTPPAPTAGLVSGVYGPIDPTAATNAYCQTFCRSLTQTRRTRGGFTFFSYIYVATLRRLSSRPSLPLRSPTQPLALLIMADPRQELTDIHEEGTSSSTTPIQSPAVHEPRSAPPPVATNDPPTMRRRRASSASHVSVDYFDPEGVQQLGRTLSRQMSTQGSPVISSKAPKKNTPSDVDSEVTLAEAFDLEKTLKNFASM